MEKRFKNGICIGKFMPIHKGHIYMIETAAKQCETMHVLVCTRDVEPINGVLRHRWAKDIFKDRDDIIVHHCTDDLPQYPEDDPDFWKIWHDATYEYVPDIDAVFASEEYVFPYAECLGVEGVLVDLDRTTVPVSGTAIRENPLDNWEYIPEVVKGYYRKKVAVLGPESTGKSTLIKKVAGYYLCDYVEEYGREYVKEHPAKELVSGDFTTIAGQHWINVLDKYRNTEGSLLFLDTEAIVTLTFGKMYLGNDFDPMVEENLRSMIRVQKERISLYILTMPDLEWVDDGTRDFGEEKDRWKHFFMIKFILEEENIDYSIVDGQGEDRTKNAIREIEKKVIKPIANSNKKSIFVS